MDDNCFDRDDLPAAAVEKGTRLHKFLSPASDHFSDTLRELLFNNRIWLSGRANFNDPFDCYAPYNSDISLKRVRERALEIASDPRQYRGSTLEWIQKTANFKLGMENQVGTRELREMRRDLAAAHESRLDLAGIGCFADNFRSSLMWSHYANSHTGVCVVFRCAGDPASILHFTFRVTYGTDRPSIDFRKAPFLAGPSSKGSYSYFKQAFLHKAREWSYEGEWRTIHPYGANSYRKYLPQELVGFVFGSNCDHTVRSELIHLSRQSGKQLKFWNASISSTRYEVQVSSARQ